MSPAPMHSPAAPAAKQSAPTLLVPFTRAAKEHVEPFTDVQQVLNGNTTTLGPFDIPAYGFVRGIFLLVEATGGAAGAAVVAKTQDAPWSAINEVSILDVNGAPIVGPLSGHDLYLINKYGGYSYSSEPKQSPTFTDVGAAGNFSFLLRIPIEVNARDALGALANQNASSTYKLKITLNSASAVYATAPATTLPTVRVRAELDAWTQPPATDLRGNANATLPPAHGTTSYWSKTVINLAAGFNTVRLPRVGNYIRNLLFVWRDVNGVRVAGSFPDPASIYWDTRLLKQYIRGVWSHQMQQRTDYTAAAEAVRGLDVGVFHESMIHDFDMSLGGELRDLWLPTVQSTRLELTGTFGVAGALTILTNDVSPAGDIFV